jgi:hypothetical protein
MNKDPGNQAWFDNELSDEAAFTIYSFLAQFTHEFESEYYGQIRRYRYENTPQRPLPVTPLGGNSGSQLEQEKEGDIPF